MAESLIHLHSHSDASLQDGMFSPSDLLLDKDDEYLLQYKLTYQFGGVKLSKVYIHRIIMKCPKGYVVDHINGNRFDNRKINLRICLQKENMRNRKANAGRKFKGIKRANSGWQARIGIDGKDIHLGTFPTEIEAAKAYNVAAVKYHKEYARLNDV